MATLPQFKQRQLARRSTSDIDRLAKQLGWQKTKSQNRPDRAHLPLLVRSEKLGWGLLTDGMEGQQWTLRTAQGPASLDDTDDLKTIVRLVPPDRRHVAGPDGFQARLRAHLKEFRGTIGEAITASFIINVLTAVVSFFSLQVYDKVIPNESIPTLWSLAAGVAIALFFDFSLRLFLAKMFIKIRIQVIFHFFFLEFVALSNSLYKSNRMSMCECPSKPN